MSDYTPVSTTPYTPPTEKFQNEAKLRKLMATDFAYYAEHNLQILSKGGGVVPFKLNRAQLHIDAKLNEQLRQTGKIRALILKARQQGASTLIAGRFYWRTTGRKGVNAFILSHAMDTTRKLFMITRRYHDHCDELFKPDTQAASAHELVFDGLDSSYYVGTAGAKETGRGGTIHYMHGSEVAFWANADMHFGGIMQSIPTGKLSKGTEVILESTGNGESGKFYDLCEEARSGEGEYQLIFTPWFWQDEYEDVPPAGWEPKNSRHSDLLLAGQENYDLSLEQLYWMHLKRNELGSDWLFQQEYPATIDEAFQSSGDESFLPVNEVEEAMIPKPDIIELDDMPCIGALDPAGAGQNADRTAIGHMIGSRVYPVEYIRFQDSVALAETTRVYIEKNQCDRFYVDVNGLGVGVYDILIRIHRLGNIVKPCNFGAGSTDLSADGSKRYANKRVECYGRLLSWMREQKRELPQQAELKKDMTAARRIPHVRPEKMESKDELKRRGIKSPDGSDVVAMFHTEKVHTVKRLRYHGGSGTVNQNRLPDYDELTFGMG